MYKSIYRGLTFTQEQIDEYKGMKDCDVSLKGFSSASMNRDIAIKFALEDVRDAQKPVLLQIDWRGIEDHFRLNSNQFSAYPNEEEILLNDGLSMKVIDIQDEFEIDGG